MNIEDVKVMIKNGQVIIFYNGTRLVEPIEKYKDMSKEEIKKQYVKQFQ